MPRILLATHGGKGAEGAARVAALLAERHGAELDVLAVFEPITAFQPSIVDYGFGVVPLPSIEEFEALHEVIRADAVAQLRRCRIPETALTVRMGPAASEIAAAACASGADLIVTGLGPHQLLDRALGGETALELVQIASTPILAVPPDATALPQRVVAAIDFTPTSIRAAQAAARSLIAGDAPHLVHVSPGHQAGAPAPSEARGPGGVVPHLRQVAAQLGVAPGVEVEAIERRGDPGRALLEYVEQAGADLIALGSHGYGIWKRLTLGSVASKVMRLATRAVLVAPLGSVVRAA